jgi:hypothetical protein
VPNCPHGFAQSECLICATLGTTPGAAKATKTKVAPPPEVATALASSSFSSSRSSQLPATREPAAGGDSERGRRGPGFFWALLAAIVVGALVIWAFWGVVSLAFHVAEFVLLALVAGWVGYKVGHARGRRGH